MDKLQIKDRWPEVKSKIKNAYPTLTEEDLKYQDGREEELLGTLQKKTGKKREELVAWLNGLQTSSL